MPSASHVVIHSGNAWGHLKPMISFASRISHLRPKTVFTVLTSALYCQKAIDEIARVAPQPTLFHVLDIQGPPADILAYILEFKPAFDALWNRGSVTCRTSGKVLKGLPRPSLTVVDLFSYAAAAAVRDIAGNECAIGLWLVGPGFALAKFGPKEIGGSGDMLAHHQSLIANGEDADAAALKVWVQADGKVTRTPGLPPLFDYEWCPQTIAGPPHVVAFDCHRLVQLSDAGLLPSTMSLDGEATHAMRDTWFEASGKTLWTVGPASSPESEVRETSQAPMSEEGVKVIGLLDRVHESHGARSVVYPSEPTYLWAVIDELIAAGIPFIFAQASPFAVVPPEQAAAIEASGISMSSPWVPQDKLLAHPAIGWFITHGGWNSTQEALLTKVPLVFWPLAADQPANAAFFAEKHNAAYELLSVRIGQGAQTPYRCVKGKVPAPEFSVEGVRKEMRDLLTLMEGEDGKRVRAKFERLGRAFGSSWGKHGESRHALEQFLQSYNIK